MIEEADPADLLDFNQALEVLGVSRPTLYRWIHQRRVKAFKAGKQWRFHRSDLEAVLEESSPASDRARGDLAAMAEALGEDEPDDVLEADLAPTGVVDFDAGYGPGFFCSAAAAKAALETSVLPELDDDARRVMEAEAAAGEALVGVVS